MSEQVASVITMALGFVVGATLISITDGGVLGYVLSAISIALAYGIVIRGIRPHFDRRRRMAVETLPKSSS